MSQLTKPKKRKCSFNDSWLKMENFKNWLSKLPYDDGLAKCSLCSSVFSVKSSGVGDVNRHASSETHKTNLKNSNVSTTITSFLVKKNSTEETNVICAEVVRTFHSIRHHHSYRSAECTISLNHKLFPDSNIVKKIHCARTKTISIAENILAPHSIENHVTRLISNDQIFSISTDASNRGNLKMFPIVIQYYTVDEGLVNFVLDLFEDPKETAKDIYNNLKNSLKSNNLKVENILSYGADNASVNYGKHKSVFVNLQNENSYLIKGNCNAHILHNTAQHGLYQLPLDIDNLVKKIYAHFSTSAKRIDALKDCYKYTDEEYSKPLRHANTRWLSLCEALKRLIDNIESVKIYFLGIDRYDCPRIISEFFWEQNDDSECIATMNELILHFSYNYMQIFNNSLLELQRKTTNSTNLYDIMNDLRKKLMNRSEHGFYGNYVNSILENDRTSPKFREKFEKTAKNVLQMALDYLKKNFDFENSVFLKLKSLNLDNCLKHNEVIEIIKLLNIRIDREKILDEICTFNEILVKIPAKERIESKSIDIWTKILRQKKLSNFSRIMESFFCIPIANDYVERIFSVIKNLWTDERNRMSINLVKSEICIRFNYMTCSQFYDYIKDNTKLLNAAKSSKKYIIS
jgi:hypothetical protein